jgi:antibiotic biosynthesis monooxygenase (ABM) superfamily enzyme
MTQTTTPQSTAPVTVVVRRKVRSGQQAGYEGWLQALLDEVQGFPGYLGTDVQRPNGTDRTYVSIFRFDTADNLERFERSELRRRHLARVAPFIEGDAIWDRLTGLEVWFDPPPGTVAAAPVRWKMVILLICVVFLLVEALTFLVGLLPVPLPPPLRLLLIITAQVCLLTYVIMPPLTRRLAFWLFSNQSNPAKE